jgi:uncharacterized protein YabE (DUF348 family)
MKKVMLTLVTVLVLIGTAFANKTAPHAGKVLTFKMDGKQAYIVNGKNYFIALIDGKKTRVYDEKQLMEGLAITPGQEATIVYDVAYKHWSVTKYTCDC